MKRSMTVSRRSVLRGAAGLSAAGVLAGCGSSSSEGNSLSPTDPGTPSRPMQASSGTATNSSTGRDVLPAYIPYEGTKPDIAAANQYCAPGFTHFPMPPIRGVTRKPGNGGKLSASVATQAGTPKPMGSNSWWKAVNDRLGLTLDLKMAPAKQYRQKIATIVASGDISDVMRLRTQTPNVDKMLAAKFADLSEHLSGDNVKKYPFLANIPTETWKSAIFGGKIYGVPMPTLLVSSRLIGRADIMDKLSLDSDVSDKNEFLDLCKSLTDVRHNRWAMAQPAVSGYIAEMMGVPNDWRIQDGKFTKDYETDEYISALSLIKKMWDQEYFYPDSFAGTVNTTQLFTGRKIALMNSGGSGMVGTYALYVDADKDLRMTFMAPPKAAGGGLAKKWLGLGQYGLTAVNLELPGDRIVEALEVLNLLAGPFGTEEYLLVHYGAKGKDYTQDEKTGEITRTKEAAAEKLPVNYLPGTRSQYYSGGYPEVTKAACEYEQLVTQNVEVNPLVGLYSSTSLEKSASLSKVVNQAASDVIQGRKPLSSWRDVVSDWRKSGGDQMRKEFQESYTSRAN